MKTTTTAVLVTTLHRGVFFGYVTGVPLARANNRITLANARCCIYWTSEVKGFLGLAATGPTASCRVSPAVPLLTLEGVTSLAQCAPEAVTAWEAAPWA